MKEVVCMFEWNDILQLNVLDALMLVGTEMRCFCFMNGSGNFGGR
jgi:hypothetical protein